MHEAISESVVLDALPAQADAIQTAALKTGAQVRRHHFNKLKTFLTSRCTSSARSDYQHYCSVILAQFTFDIEAINILSETLRVVVLALRPGDGGTIGCSFFGNVHLMAPRPMLQAYQPCVKEPAF